MRDGDAAEDAEEDAEEDSEEDGLCDVTASC